MNSSPSAGNGLPPVHRSSTAPGADRVGSDRSPRAMAAASSLSFVQTPAGQLARGHGSETNTRGTARETRTSLLVSAAQWDIGNENLHTACHQAMRPYPITLLNDGLLHTTVEMVEDTTADRITASERQDLVEALRHRLTDTAPFQVQAGSPIANKAGALLDLSPDEPLIDLKGRVQDAFVEARGPEVIQHEGGRPHTSLGYSWDTADSDPLQSALRRISPSHAPVHMDRVHLVEVEFREHARGNRKSAWEISWNPVSVIPLGASYS